jgi:hypothetical protein
MSFGRYLFNLWKNLTTSFENAKEFQIPTGRWDDKNNQNRKWTKVAVSDPDISTSIQPSNKLRFALGFLTTY